MDPARASGRAILLIEDDRDIGALLTELLAEAGCATTIATTVAAGIALLKRRRFALILADAFAGDGLGEARWQALEAIRGAAGSTPTIILTAHRAAQFGDYAARGHAALLEKPFDLDELLALVASLLREGEGLAAPHGDRARE